ncbi:Connector enhancer of ksr, partial [Operophtera brumata]
MVLESRPTTLQPPPRRPRMDWTKFQEILQATVSTRPINSPADVDEFTTNLTADILAALAEASHPPSGNRLPDTPARLAGLLKEKPRLRSHWQRTRDPAVKRKLNALCDDVRAKIRDDSARNGRYETQRLFESRLHDLPGRVHGVRGGRGEVARARLQGVPYRHRLLLRERHARRHARLDPADPSRDPLAVSTVPCMYLDGTNTAFYFASDTRDAMLAWIQLIHGATLLPSLLSHMDSSNHFSETDYSETESDNDSPEKRSERDKDRAQDKDKDKDKSKFGSLKKLTGRMQRSESQENMSHAATSLDRKYLRFFSRNKSKDDSKPKPELKASRKIPKPINYIHASNPNLLDFEKSDFVTKPALQPPRARVAKESAVGLVTLEQFMLQKQAEERRQLALYSDRVLLGVRTDNRRALDTIGESLHAGRQHACTPSGTTRALQRPRAARRAHRQPARARHHREAACMHPVRHHSRSTATACCSACAPTTGARSTPSVSLCTQGGSMHAPRQAPLALYSDRVLLGVRTENRRALDTIVADVIYGEVGARLGAAGKPISVKGKDGYEKIVYPDESSSEASRLGYESLPDSPLATSPPAAPSRGPPPLPALHAERWRDSLRRNDK